MASKLSQPQHQELRIVLVGKTGVGKSAAGNTILRREAFMSKISSSSVTAECQKEKEQFGGQSLSVIDTPGLFDIKSKGHPGWYDKNSQDHVIKEILRCFSLAAPGPHVFLVVLQLGRFSTEEQKTVEIIKAIFGKKAERYTMVLFTRGDDLKAEGGSIETLIGDNEDLKKIVAECHGRIHVFDNRDKSPAQVIELLKKINSMVKRNGGSHYTNDMLQEAERAITEKMKSLLKANPRMTIEEARRMAERNNTFTEEWKPWLIGGAAAAGAGVGAAAGAAVGGRIGTVLGLAGGPAGAAAGAVAGTVIGGAASAAAIKIHEKCIIQ